MSSTEASEETITICVCWMMLARPKSNLFRSCFGILFFTRLSNSPTLYVFVQRWSWPFFKCHRLFINNNCQQYLSTTDANVSLLEAHFFTDPWTVLEGRKRLLIWHVWSSKKNGQSPNIALGIHRASPRSSVPKHSKRLHMSADFPKTLINNSGPLFGSTLERRKELQSLRVGCFSSFLSTISFDSHSSINSKYSCNVF